MATYKIKCRLCGKMTDHIERVVTDNLPPYVKSLQCVKCGVMGIVLMEDLKDADV
jgi:uncharacterized Zn finger protein